MYEVKLKCEMWFKVQITTISIYPNSNGYYDTYKIQLIQGEFNSTEFNNMHYRSLHY